MRILQLFVGCMIFCSLSLPSEAQFLKKLGDKVEKSIDRRIERRTDQAVEKSLDKVEDGTERAVKNVAEASDKSAEENNEKTIQKEASWPLATPEGKAGTTDPIPENHTITLTGSGPDLYLEYRMEMATVQEQQVDMDITMKMYASPSKGAGRSEMKMQMPVIGEMSMVTLVNFNNPTHLILLNDKKKQYSIMDMSKIEEADSKEQYTVTKLGEEKVYGLNAIHAKAVSADGDEFEIWTSKEIPGYEKMMELYGKNQQMGSDNLWKELEKAGCEGFMVKMKVITEGGASIMAMTKVEKTDIPKEMLLVPAGYKESKGAWTKRFMKR